MANGKSTWKYNKLLTARRNYFLGGGGINIRGAASPPPIDSGMGGAQNPNAPYNTEGGTQTTTDTTINPSIGKMGAIASLAGQAASDISGMISNIGASDVRAREKELTTSINKAQLGLQSDAEDFDSLADLWSNQALLSKNITGKDLGAKSTGNVIGSAGIAGLKGSAAGFGLGPIGAIAGGVAGTATSLIGNLVRNSKANAAADRVKSVISDVNNFNQRSLAARANNLQLDQMNNLARNYQAFGGELGTNGANFTNGLLQINNGGSHEANPYEGVPMGVDSEGVPNLVEEGETVFNDYVFSKRLLVPHKFRKKYKLGGNKNQLSFADASKILARESEERPNDPISQRGMQALMADLTNAQEELKQEMQQKEMEQQMNMMQSMGIDPMMAMQNMPEEAELPMMNAYGGELNKFAGEPGTSSYMDRRVMAPIQETSYSYGANSQNNSSIYKDWDTFKFGDIPLYNNGTYAPIYTDKAFQDWLRGEAGAAFIKNWWGNKSNAPDYYSEVDSKGVKKIKPNTSAPTIEQLLGSNSNGLMYDKNYGDAHRFGLAALEEYMRTNSKDVKDRRFLQTVKNGKVVGSNLIDDYYKDVDENGVSWLSKYDGRKEVSRALKYDEKEKQWYNNIYYRDPESPVGHYVSLLGEDGKETQRLLYDDAMKQGLLKGRRITGNTGKDEEGNDVSYYELEPKIKEGKYADWLRYAPAVSYGLGAIESLAATPDYSNADALLEATRTAGTYQPVRFNPIGNYLQYKPFDRNYYLNKMSAEAGASRRALLQNSGLNRGIGITSLLAADTNAQNQIGALARQSEEYNLAQRHQVGDFNRTTNITNSQGFLQADMANQQALASMRDFNLRGTMAAAEMRQRAQEALDARRSQNVTGLFQTLADIGVDEYTSKQRDKYINKLGMPDSSYWTRKASKGGRIKRKKGFTL